MAALTTFFSAEDISDMNGEQIRLLNAVVEDVFDSPEVKKILRSRLDEVKPAVEALSGKGS